MECLTHTLSSAPLRHPHTHKERFQVHSYHHKYTAATLWMEKPPGVEELEHSHPPSILFLTEVTPSALYTQALGLL